MKKITIYNIRGIDVNEESFLEGTTCEKIEIFGDGTINITTKEKVVITYSGLAYKLEESK